MAEPMPSYEVIAARVAAEYDAHIRHADALDGKAGIVLGFSGAVAAISSQHVVSARAPGLGLAVVAALASLTALAPQRFPTWELRDLRRYLNAEPNLTRVVVLDTSIVMIQELKAVLQRKVRWLRIAAWVLAGAILLTATGTIVD